MVAKFQCLFGVSRRCSFMAALAKASKLLDWLFGAECLLADLLTFTKTAYVRRAFVTDPETSEG